MPRYITVAFLLVFVCQFHHKKSPENRGVEFSGEYRIRTDHLLHAMQAL